MATASPTISSTSLTFPSPQNKPLIFLQSPSFLKFPTSNSTKFPLKFFNFTSQINLKPVNAVSSPSNSSPVSSPTKFYGLCFVVGDDVNTDQIIPSNYSSLNPSNPEDYKELGSYAFDGLHPSSYALRFVEENGLKSKYSVIIAGSNFGSGSSKELAAVALSASGTKAVVAESFDGVFFKSLVSSGQILALQSEVRICDEFKTGDVATIDVAERILINQTTGKVLFLKNFGDDNVN